MLPGSSLTISGDSTSDKDTIYYTTNDTNSAINSSSGSLSISGKPLIHSEGRCITINGSSNFSMYGGYLYSENNNALTREGTGQVVISNSILYAPCKGARAIFDDGNGSMSITNSKLGSGFSDEVSNETKVNCQVCRFNNGQISFVDSQIIGGKNASYGIHLIGAGGTVSCTGNTSVYSHNSNVKPNYPIGVDNGKVTIDSTGIFCSKGDYAVNVTIKDSTKNYVDFLDLKKGIFASNTSTLINQVKINNDNEEFTAILRANATGQSITMPIMNSYKTTYSVMASLFYREYNF